MKARSMATAICGSILTIIIGTGVYLEKCFLPVRIARDIIENARQAEIEHWGKYSNYVGWSELLDGTAYLDPKDVAAMARVSYLRLNLPVVQKAYQLKLTVNKSGFSLVALPRSACFCKSAYFADDHTLTADFRGDLLPQTTVR